MQTSLFEADHYSHIAQCKNVEPWWWKFWWWNSNGFGSLPVPRSGYDTAIIVFVAHLLILEYPNHHQNLISSSLLACYSGPFQKISSQFGHNFWSNVVHKQTNRQTNASKNINSFAKEVNMTNAVHINKQVSNMAAIFQLCHETPPLLKKCKQQSLRLRQSHSNQ